MTITVTRRMTGRALTIRQWRRLTELALALTASDQDGNNLSFAIVDPPGHGMLSGRAPDVAYTPEHDFAGEDVFTFTASDGTIDSALATVRVTVRSVNDPPVAEDQSVSTNEDVPVDITLSGTDAEADPLSFAIIDEASPRHAERRRTFTHVFAQRGLRR